MGIWNTWFHKQGLQCIFLLCFWLVQGLVDWLVGVFVVCFQLCSDSWHTLYFILGSLSAHSPSCSNSTFLPFLSYLHFSKLITVFLTAFLVAPAWLCVRAVHWLARGHTPIAYTADFGVKTEVFLSVWLNLWLSPCSYKNLQIFEISEFTRVLLRSSIHTSGSSITGLMESIPVSQALKPVRHHHRHRCNRYAVLPDCSDHEQAAHQVFPKSSKQMTCFIVYFISPLYPIYSCLPSSTPPK